MFPSPVFCLTKVEFHSCPSGVRLTAPQNYQETHASDHLFPRILGFSAFKPSSADSDMFLKSGPWWIVGAHRLFGDEHRWMENVHIPGAGRSTHHGIINGNFRNLNWRYLPYIRPIFQAYFSGLCKRISPQNMAKNMVQWQCLHFRILFYFPYWNSVENVEKKDRHGSPRVLLLGPPMGSMTCQEQEYVQPSMVLHLPKLPADPVGRPGDDLQGCRR